MTTLLNGFLTSAGLIVAIGAQNAFVIQQGLRRRHLLLTATLCATIDAMLIMLGVLGLGSIIAAQPQLVLYMKYVAIAFLIVYGALSLRAARQAKATYVDHGDVSAKKAIMLVLAFSLLNPHVYLDTVLLLGSIAQTHPKQERMLFAVGAMSASFAWFFALTYASRMLAPWLSKQRTQQCIDVGIGLIMWFIAWSVAMFA